MKLLDRLKDPCKIKIFILTLLFLGGGYQIKYAIDTFYTFHKGFAWAAEDMLYRNGRPVMALMYRLFAMTHMRNEAFYYISYVIAFVFAGLSVYLFESILKRYIDNENICIILSFLSIINVYTIEYFMFIEQGGFMIAIFLNILAVWFLNIYLAEHKKINIVYATLSILIGLLTYQSTIALYFILMLPFIWHEAKTFKDYIKSFGILVILYWIPVGLYLMMFKMFFSDMRVSTETKVIQKISKIDDIVKYSFKTTYHLLPEYFYLCLLVGIIAISIVSIIYFKLRYIETLNLMIILLTSSILPVGSVLVADSWGAPRIIYPMMSIVGVYGINYYLNICENTSATKLENISKGTIIFLSLLLLFSQYLSYTNIYNDKYEMNYADRVRVQEIGQAIYEYEVTTGNKIIQITFYRDFNHKVPFYDDIYSESDLVVSAFHSWDSQLNVINYYLGTHYKRGAEDTYYKDYFSKLDWNSYSPSQIVCDKDTLHYCVY